MLAETINFRAGTMFEEQVGDHAFRIGTEVR